MNKIITFVQEAKEELMKVNWPSKKQTLNYTMLVVAVSLAVAGFLGALTGLGGGVVVIPALTLALGVDMKIAMGASLVSVIATSSGSTACRS